MENPNQLSHQPSARVEKSEFEDFQDHKFTILFGILIGLGIVTVFVFVTWICSKLHDHDKRKYSQLV